VRKSIEEKMIEGGAKRGFEIGPMEEHHQRLKAALKEVEGKQTILDTLDRRLTTLNPELEEEEVIQAENALTDVVKLHASACDALRKKLKELAEELGSKRKFLDKLERAKSWISKMGGELEDSQPVPLNASDVSKKIELLKKHQSAVKDFEDGPISEIKREADGLQKECTPQQQNELQTVILGILLLFYFEKSCKITNLFWFFL
jgi:DNA repair exonuclease SbcCD ATPase subunit